MRQIYFFIFLIILMSASGAFPQDNNRKDPISNSYILNQLEMETDSNPFNESTGSSEGEIIFDNSFDDRLSSAKHPAMSGRTSGILMELRKKDSRWHLVEYRVKAKDNLWRISKKFNTDIATISALNNLSEDHIIKPDDMILIPARGGVKYKIRKGDTLNSISKKYGTDIEKIAEHNNIDGTNIIAGRTIFIPGATRKQPEPEKIIRIAEKKSGERHNTAANEKRRQDGNVKRLALSWPLKGPITSGFGYRTHPFSGRKRFHCGLDIGAEIGTPVRAASDGVVIFSGWKGTYGNLIVIQHKNNYITVYAHNSKNLVSTDETIKKGEKIAL